MPDAQEEPPRPEPPPPDPDSKPIEPAGHSEPHPEVEFLGEVRTHPLPAPLAIRPEVEPQLSKPRSTEPRRDAPKPATTPALSIRCTIPNGTVGKPYDAVVAASVHPSAEPPPGYRLTDISIRVLRIGTLEPFGLSEEVQGHQLRITGTPRIAGDFPIKVSFSVCLRDRVWTSGEKAITLTINPDPRSLWKELEPDQHAPFPCEHQRKARIVGESLLIAASRRGRSHANKGEFRDDEFEIFHDRESGWYAIAVADGAGSAPLSRRGAAVATRSAVESLKTAFREELGPTFLDLVANYSREDDENGTAISATLTQTLGAAMRTARQAVADEATQAQKPIEHFATTLLLTMARRSSDWWFLATIAVGDGGVVALREDSRVVALSTADSGEFAGQTRFLTMPHLWDHDDQFRDRIRWKIFPELVALIAMTDGVSDPKFPTDQDFGDKKRWHDLWAELEREVGFANDDAEAKLLDWLQFWAVGSHDDRTIAILRPDTSTLEPGR